MIVQLPSRRRDTGRDGGLFRRVLCGVDSSPASLETLRQARTLVDADGAVTLFDVDADTEPRVLVERGHDHDLIALAPHGRSRARGFMLGSAASFALHSAHVPVLIARDQPAISFPGTVLVGTAGLGDLDSVLLAARIAARFRTPLMLAHVSDGDGADAHHELAVQTTLAKEITRTEPVVLSVPGEPVARLVSMAVTTNAGLLVVGSTGREGIRAVASVSERVAHRAQCSVLVLRSDPTSSKGDPDV